MQVDDPPYLSVGTAVSAKYKGAFCEAKVSKVVRIVKCKVTYKMGLGNATVNDDQIKGTLRVGAVVQAKHPERKEFVEATITKIQDCSQYTVVFDDGDITTLRRTALCLKSGRHFNESGRRGRRNRQLKEDSSEGEGEEENEPDLEGYSIDIGKVVSVETTDKKRGKDNWFPGLVVIPSAQPTVRINVKDEYLVRSFKDGRYYTVPKKEVSEFSRESADKVESAVLGEAVQKALKFLDNDELPVHWERNSLFNQSVLSESEENYSDISEDEPFSEEKDRFVAHLLKFLDDSQTPLNKTPTIANKDIDLHRLFCVVQKLGGYNRVTNQNKWTNVTHRLKLPVTQNTANQVKSAYKRCLQSYEVFHTKLGVTMVNHFKSTKKNQGRSLIRDKDRATPANSPKPETEEPEKKEEKEAKEPKEPPKEPKDPKESKEKEEKPKKLIKKDDEKIKKKESDVDTESESSTKLKREKAKEKKIIKERPKPTEKIEEAKDDGQLTRSKSISKKEKETPEKKEKEGKIKTPNKVKKKEEEEVKDKDKKRGRKRTNTDEKTNSDSNSESSSVSVGDKLKVYYGPTHESKVTYEAKVIEIDKDSILVHYTGWNTRYDEWINPGRIAENLSASNKAKRKGVGKNVATPKAPAKRGRGMSITGRSEAPPRSTTPSSVTSSGSRTKSPATPATRSSRLQAKQDYTRRPRISQSSDSEASDESLRTRSSLKTEEEVKTYKRKAKASPDKKKVKEKDSEEEDNLTLPKGRDFDLNQIRSELKGFNKALKVESPNEQVVSSSDSEEKVEVKAEVIEKSSSSDDVYEFKEPEPFEFEARSSDKNVKKRLPRLFEELDKSPKKKAKSPVKEDKRFKRNKKEEEDEELKKEEDAFDKLVGSPTFNFVKTDKTDTKAKMMKSIIEQPLTLFSELPETVDDFRDMELSDCDSQSQIFSRPTELFSDTFTKTSPDRSNMDLEFASGKLDDCKLKDSDDDDLRAQIQRVLAHSSSTDDDSGDALSLTKSTISYQKKPLETKPVEEIVREPSPMDLEPEKPESVIIEKNFSISPALQETDSALLESITSASSLLNKVNTEIEVVKKAPLKIADSLLQKFSSFKTEAKEEKQEAGSDIDSSDSEQLVIARSDEEVGEVKVVEAEVEEKVETEVEKVEEEPEAQINSLLCEETIPRSPAPVVVVEPSVESKEMPFASIPSSSKAVGSSSPVQAIEQTPPATPESTLSVSPSGENGLMSNADDSTNEPSFNKVFSEEDTQEKKVEPATVKKRRKSCKEEVPAKRGRKPLNRSRHNSDSDASEQSVHTNAFDRSNRSPRPSKYNFFVDFAPGLDRAERIALLQQKLAELRKTYADVKAELATVERRRKKIRRRGREALKASKQEMACA